MAGRPEEGAQFVRFFGPLLDALRALGGSGTPEEVVDRIAADLQIPDSVQNELLPSGEPRFRNQVAWARFYLVRDGLVDSSRREGFGALRSAVATPVFHLIRPARYSGTGSVFSTSGARCDPECQRPHGNRSKTSPMLFAPIIELRCCN